MNHINTRLSMKEAAHLRTVRNKPKRLEKWLPVINHPGFEDALKCYNGTAQNVVRMYLTPNETYPTISEALNIGPSEAFRYFNETMKKIKKLLEV